jgi:parvulin-like peptidyl-prolyl isomerase
MPSRVVKKTETLTRKQRRHLGRDQRQTGIVLGVTGAIILVVIGVIVFGYVNTFYLRVRQPAAIVYGNPITIAQVQEEVKYERLQLVASYNRFNLAATGTLDQNEAAAYSAQATAVANQLADRVGLGQSALQFLIDAQIARHEAALREITVTDEEVQAAVNDILGYIPEATLTAMPSPSKTLTPTVTSTHTLVPTVTPGGPTVTPSPTLTPTSTPTLTPTIGGTVTVTLTPSLTPTITPVPTATPFTEQAFEKYYTLYIADIERQTGITEEEFRERVRSELYIEKVRAAVMAEVPRTEQEAHLAWIVVDSEQKAIDALARLQQGESWNTVAAAVSTDTATKDKGGDIGWISQENPPTEIEKTAFNLPVGDFSHILNTGANTWVILKLIEKGPRPMPSEKYAAAQQTAYQTWLDAVRNNTEIVDKKGMPEELIPTTPNIK